MARTFSLLFVPSPRLHFNLKKWSSDTCKIAPAPHLIGCPCAAPSKYPKGYALSIGSNQMPLTLSGFSITVKCEAMARILVATI